MASSSDESDKVMSNAALRRSARLAAGTIGTSPVQKQKEKKRKAKKESSGDDGDAAGSGDTSMNALMLTMNATIQSMKAGMITQTGMDSSIKSVVSECKSYVHSHVTNQLIPVREDVDNTMASVRAIQDYI